MELRRLLPVVFVIGATALAQTFSSVGSSSSAPAIPAGTSANPAPTSTSVSVSNPAPAATARVTGTIPAAPLNAAQNETTITLDVGFGIRFVPPARVSVPNGEKLRIVAPEAGGGVNYIWTKNGRAIAGAADSHILVIPLVVSDDAGTYACLFSTPTTLPQPSQSLILGVGPTDRLLNLSTRSIVGPAADGALTTGFAVAAGSGGKKIIIRAVGPSLASFGVANPLAQPVLRIYDANGRLYDYGYGYPAVVGGLTYETDLAESLARAGAFPLPAGTRDVTEMRPFISGTYTASVTSGDGSTGTVLLEIYEVP
ncbi:MAG: immunoglobulin domain-containing protein [Verrucomicrobiota bacterium]